MFVHGLFGAMLVQSQSPDGDFFDPAEPTRISRKEAILSHSPLTGIFLIRRSGKGGVILGNGSSSQSPDGDFFDPAAS